MSPQGTHRRPIGTRKPTQAPDVFEENRLRLPSQSRFESLGRFLPFLCEFSSLFAKGELLGHERATFDMLFGRAVCFDGLEVISLCSFNYSNIVAVRRWDLGVRWIGVGEWDVSRVCRLVSCADGFFDRLVIAVV